jgi:hypothetical protein
MLGPPKSDFSLSLHPHIMIEKVHLSHSNHSIQTPLELELVYKLTLTLTLLKYPNKVNI